MTLTLTIPGRPLSSNDRVHWRARAERIAIERDAARLWARQAWGPRPPRLAWPVEIVVADHCRTANLRDVGNCQPSVKAIVDGLTDFGLWPDDDASHVARLVFLPPVKTGTDELVITIRSIE